MFTNLFVVYDGSSCAAPNDSFFAGFYDFDNEGSISIITASGDTYCTYLYVVCNINNITASRDANFCNLYGVYGNNSSSSSDAFIT